MSIEPVKAEISALLAQANDKLELAERALEGGSDAQRLRAADQIVLLKGRKEALEIRAAELEHCPDDIVNSVVQRLREECFLVMQDLRSLIDGG
jgi:hypothetical protein